ncbi:type II secretion system protein GspM [Pseudacidovorax sp. RU35E]|uniref:type II secretion system protein GspM n=1 Tax=Pseudacidovorax sp. RU35E TaxID=1907403 RepID=UPI00095679A0|nr:type II secretion system protein GspM [Pseudacidovorax sp. RU35E]SIR19656.1 general secretion pathway protein M [Pseudacidovorax sp. RU35E]
MNRRPASQARLQAWWATLAPRERRLAAIAATLVAVALLWWVALAPALRTLSAAPAAHAALDAQLQQMATLQAQARALQGQPKPSREDALRGIESTTSRGLGPDAQVRAAGGDAVAVGLRSVPADQLAEWLAQVRANARAVPREAHLTRAQTAAPASPGATANATAVPGVVQPSWQGTFVMGLPAAR